jgi:hypothetical protein
LQPNKFTAFTSFDPEKGFWIPIFKQMQLGKFWKISITILEGFTSDIKMTSLMLESNQIYVE